LTSPHTNGVPRKGTLMPVGFYKRGCQGKTLFLFREGRCFFAIQSHPRMHEPWLGRGWRLAEPIFPVVPGDVF
jgi:hypothetical protein